MKSLLALAGVVLAVAAACGGSPAATASVSPTRSTVPTPTQASPTATSLEAPASPSQALVIPHEDPELEALLPDEVDGIALTKLSVGPVSSIGVSGAQRIKDAAKAIGDGSGEFGLAYAGDPGGTFNLFALQIPGADSSALLTQFAQMTLAETVGGKVEAANLGGRDLVHVIDPVSSIGDVWFYAEGDTLLGVQAGSPEQATDLLALLS